MGGAMSQCCINVLALLTCERHLILPLLTNSSPVEDRRYRALRFLPMAVGDLIKYVKSHD
jgi:hypothetical protein